MRAPKQVSAVAKFLSIRARNSAGAALSTEALGSPADTPACVRPWNGLSSHSQPPILPRSVTVAPEILDLFVKVRILARQPIGKVDGT